MDSQSTKTNYEGDAIGFHGGKKIKGRSRQIAVDTQDNIWDVLIHAANIHDTVGGCDLIDQCLEKLPDIKVVCADAAYRGTFVDHVKENWNKAVYVSEKIKDSFAVIPKRWVVGWLGGRENFFLAKWQPAIKQGL